MQTDQQFINAARCPTWQYQLETILESTGEGIFALDLDGRCVFINRAGMEMLGHTPDTIIGQNMHELIHHSHPDGSYYPVDDCPIFNAFAKGKPCRLDNEVLWRADNSSFYAEYSSFPLFDQKTIIGAVIIFSDISSRKQVETLVKQMQENLEQSVAERTQELNIALQENALVNERLREYSAHLETVREFERSRIAREIHDELGSVLSVLKLHTGWLHGKLGNQPNLHVKTGTMARLIDMAIVDLGRIITDLHPSILDHDGLWAALEWHCQEFLDATKLRGQLRMNIAKTTPVPSSEFAATTFRIFQEILTNIAKHANAMSIQVEIKIDDNFLMFIVDDDGRGITHAQLYSSQSYGLIGMNERAHYFGGRIDITPGLTGGTSVRVSMPLN